MTDLFERSGATQACDLQIHPKCQCPLYGISSRYSDKWEIVWQVYHVNYQVMLSIFFFLNCYTWCARFLWIIWVVSPLQNHKVHLGFLTLTKLLGLGKPGLKREKLDVPQTQQIFWNTHGADKSHRKFKHYLALHGNHTNKWLWIFYEWPSTKLY